MATDSRAILNTEVTANVLDGNNRTTAAGIRYVLQRMILALFNLNDDINLIAGPFFYYSGATITTVGGYRTGIVSGDIVIQINDVTLGWITISELSSTGKIVTSQDGTQKFKLVYDNSGQQIAVPYP